jgi:hypothetical protein
MADTPFRPTDEQEAWARRMGQVVAGAWADPAYKARLIADPKAVLAEQGIDVPDDIELRVVENTDDVVYLTLPPEPSEDLSDEMLEAAAGGSCLGSSGTAMCVGSVCGTIGTMGSASTYGCG